MARVRSWTAAKNDFFIAGRILLRMGRRGKAKRSFRSALVEEKLHDVLSGVSPVSPLCCRSLAMRRREKIVPIILAAGPSGRLPFPKPLALFGGKSALAIAVENCARLERPLVVLGCDAERVRSAVPRRAQVVINPGWRRGQINSLRCALKHIPAGAAFLIYPVDHPLLKRKTIQQLVRAFHGRDKSQEIVVPTHGGIYGHPAIVSAKLRREFFESKTARDVIYRVPGRVRAVEMHTRAIFADFDTEETYRACLRRFRSRK
jgi:CTP:molybdopterin cytidylyltransferase MocA